METTAKTIAAWKIKGKIQQAKLDGASEIAITLLPPEGKKEGIEIFVSLSDVGYNGIETKGDIVKLLNKGREPFLLFSEAISSIRCP